MAVLASRAIHGGPDLTVSSGRTIARNTLFNLFGQAAPFLIGVLAMPTIVRGLGTDRFGLLGLVWVVVGYFTMLDLGMGRAATRFVADAMGRRALGEIPGITWSAVTVQLAIGLVGGTALLVLAPFLVTRILHVPVNLQDEARMAFRILALAVPVVLVAAAFRGVLEAAQRFDLVNAISMPGSALNFIFPLVGALAGWNLPHIIWLLVAARAATLLGYILLACRLFPALARPFRAPLTTIRSLLTFGAWITVSNIVSPLLDQLDRLLLGSFAGVTSVGYYTPPQEVVLRMRVLPTALAVALFPAFSAESGGGDPVRIRSYYTIAIRTLAFMLAPITLGLVLLGPDLLALWLGADFARTSGPALRWLAIGAFANAVAYVPSAFLHGSNRPDLPAKFHAVELPCFLLLAWFLMPRYGVTGAGMVWAIRATADALLLLTAGAALGASPSVTGMPGRSWAWVGLVGLGVLLGFTHPWAALSVLQRVTGTALAGALVLTIGWLALLGPADRERVKTAWRHFRPAP